MADLSDQELSEVDGAGMALVLEQFMFEHRNNPAEGQLFKIGGIKSSSGEDVEISVGQLYIARADSEYGTVLAPVNLGRLNNPYKIDVIDGNSLGIQNKAVVEIAAPTQLPGTLMVNKDLDLDGEMDPVRNADGSPLLDEAGLPILKQFAAHAAGYDCLTGAAGEGTCVSRPASPDFLSGERPDIGLKLEVKVGENDPDRLNFHVQSAVFDGSYLRLWGEDNRMVGAFRLNLYSPEVSITACEDGGASCGKAILFKNFILELALGNPLQPMYIDVTRDAASGEIKTGHLVLEVKSIRESAAAQFGVAPSQLPNQLGWSGGGTREAAPNKAMWDYFKNYYENPEFRSNLYIGKMEVVDPGGTMDFGSSRIEGLLIQYMNITTHDLAP